jgi:predicted ester cyclase
MQAYGKAVDSAAATPAMAEEALIELQRKTVAEHIQKEQAKDWPGLYGTFTPHEGEAYFDVVPFQMRFSSIKGVAGFYESIHRSFPDFQITVHSEQDFPGMSIREVQITGTHSGEYCGIAPTGHRVSVALATFFVFDTATGNLNAERLYFDNNTVIAQIKGELSPDHVFDLSRIEQSAEA